MPIEGGIAKQGMESSEVVQFLEERFHECRRYLRELYWKRQELDREIAEAERLLESTRTLGRSEARRAGLPSENFSELASLRAGNKKVRIADACYEILRESGQGLHLKDLHQRLTNAGFESKSTDPVGVTGKVLDRDPRFHKPRPKERFYQLAPGEEKRPG